MGWNTMGWKFEHVRIRPPICMEFIPVYTKTQTYHFSRSGKNAQIDPVGIFVVMYNQVPH